MTLGGRLVSKADPCPQKPRSHPIYAQTPALNLITLNPRTHIFHININYFPSSSEFQQIKIHLDFVS